MIDLNKIGLSYGGGGRPVLRDVSCRFDQGSFHFLTGVSGAGKTSLLKLLHLGIQPSAGTLTMFNKEVALQSRDALAAMRQKIGVVFQDFRLIDHLSVYDNVALPWRVSGRRIENYRPNRAKILQDRDAASDHDHNPNHNLDRNQNPQSIGGNKDHAARRPRARGGGSHRGNATIIDLLGWVGLGEHIGALPPTLSGGQKQRVAIARAIINRPSLLLADEPTGNVDDEMGFRLLRLFEELNRLGTTVIVATHSRAVLQAFDYPTMVISGGRILSLEPSVKAAESLV